MIIDVEATQHLKPWLVRTLEPICDAEPGALADYILALLKHNAPEADLRKELATQLDEFLEKEGPSFINTLFTALRTKSYMPYSAPSPPSGQTASSSSQPMDNGIPIPLDALLTPTSPSDRGRKRSLEVEDRDLRPVKGPRLGDDGHHSRYGRGSWGSREGRGGRMMMSGRADYMDGGMNSAIELGMGGNGMNGRGGFGPSGRSRGICRDYHNNGYCSRGAFCKYSHGEDAVVPGQLFPMNGALPGGSGPYMPMMSGNGMAFPIAAANTPYNPHERIDMQSVPGAMGPGRVPIPRSAMVRPGDMNVLSARKAGELPVIQDLTPAIPLEEQQSASSGTAGGPSNGTYDAMAVDAPLPPSSLATMRNNIRRQRDNSRGRGTFNGEAASFRPERRNDKTLVVEKIPEDKLSLGAINDWFKKFGTVTNVAVDASGGKALVSFSNHEEAYAAWKSEEAVFGNRFVKVFWHRPMEGHGQLGTRMLAASANLVAKVSSKDSAPSSHNKTLSTTAAAAPARKASAPSGAASELAAKQQLLEQQIAEQKSLMGKLSTASAEEKKEIMARLRKLNEEMKPPAPATPAKSASPAPAPATSAKRSRGSTPRSEVQMREQLDKELDLHNASTTVDGEGEESTEELKARLEKLKAEAASLGITDDGSHITPHYSGPSRPYRGRGRGRGRGYFARGGPPRGSMKLDNRPKRLLIKGAGVDQLQAVRDWYETTGQVESAESTGDGDILVSFKSRSAAEQGLAKGTNIALIGPLSISWYTGQPSGTGVANGHTVTAVTKKEPDATEENHDIEAPTEPHDLGDETHEPEDLDSGAWGGDDFGML